MVNEPMAIYLKQNSNSLFNNLFGGQAYPLNDFDMLRLTREGVSKRLLLSLAKKSPLAYRSLPISCIFLSVHYSGMMMMP